MVVKVCLPFLKSGRLQIYDYFCFPFPMSQRQIQGKTIAINSNIWMASRLWGIRLWYWVNAEDHFAYLVLYSAKWYRILTTSLQSMRGEYSYWMGEGMTKIISQLGAASVQITAHVKVTWLSPHWWPASCSGKRHPINPSAPATLGELLCLSDSQSPHLLSRDKNNTSLLLCENQDRKWN